MFSALRSFSRTIISGSIGRILVTILAVLFISSCAVDLVGAHDLSDKIGMIFGFTFWATVFYGGYRVLRRRR